MPALFITEGKREEVGEKIKVTMCGAVSPLPSGWRMSPLQSADTCRGQREGGDGEKWYVRGGAIALFTTHHADF